MLRPYHTDTLPTRDRDEGAALLWLALGGALAVVAAILFSPLMAFASGAAWRWIAGSICIGLCFGAAALALWQAGRAARRWRAVAVSAHNHLLVPHLAALSDAPPFTLANAVTSPLAVVTPASAVPAPEATDLDATSALPTVSTAEVRQSTTTGVLHRQPTQTQAGPTTLPGPVVYDPLTGAVTHATLMTRLETDVAAALAHERPLALAVFDIDHFRTINTLYSYRFGDEVLFAVAEQLRGQLQEDALLARLGADRFAVVWSGTPFAQAHMQAEGILAAMNGKPLTITQGASSTASQERVQISLRAGLALCPDDGRSAAALLDIAEHALQAHTMANILRAPDALPLLDDLDATSAPSWPPALESANTAEPWPLSYLDVMMEKNGSIQALASAMEARDLDGIAHARNLAELAQETALLLNRSPEEARLVGLAALLHDVGNLGIPAEIFAKTEPLSQEEWAFVREHPHLGERLLTSVGGVLAAVAPIIAAQRERWDGSGYPLGTHGEAIPLGARIVAICDVYGALVSERPYRTAFTHAEALGELERCAGTQFDPAVVQAFIAAASA